MKSVRKTVAGLLGHDRRERRGTYLLSVLLIVLLSFRFIAFRSPGKGEVSDEILEAVASAPEDAVEEMGLPEPFVFDPNAASYDELLRLGLTERQAATLVNYRNSGARFRRPEDIRRVYGIDSAAAARLIPYIVIAAGDLPLTTADKGRRTLPGWSEQYSGSDGLSVKSRSEQYTVKGDLSVQERADRYYGTGNPPASGYGDRAAGAWNSSATGRTERSAGTGNPPATAGSDRHAGKNNFPANGHADGAYGSGRPLPDLNSCSAAELEQLPGIGPVLSVRIIKYRALLGGFVSKEQLGEVYGLDSSVVRMVSERVTLTREAVTPLLLDSVSFGSLARHPYVGHEMARLITAYRSLSTAPLTLGSLVGSKVITPQQAERLAPYVRPPEGVRGEDYEFILSKVLK